MVAVGMTAAPCSDLAWQQCMSTSLQVLYAHEGASSACMVNGSLLAVVL